MTISMGKIAKVLLVEDAFRFAESEVKIVAEIVSQEVVTKSLTTDRVLRNPELEHVFEPFVRLKDPMGVGFGLGLPIAKRIVQQHFGTIAFRNVKPKGARCIINLPLQATRTDPSILTP